MKMEWLKVDLEVVWIFVDRVDCDGVGCDSVSRISFSWIISSRYLKTSLWAVLKMTDSAKAPGLFKINLDGFSEKPSLFNHLDVKLGLVRPSNFISR